MLRFGLIGKTLSHSISPQIHKIIMKELNISGSYELFEIYEGELKKNIDKLIKDGIKGLNVTIPYKVAIMDCIDELSDEAEKIGAVNTIRVKNGVLKGYNTDYFGFKNTIDRFDIKIKNKDAFILGTGGAAASVYQCLHDMGALNITLVSRDKDKLKSFWNRNVISYEDLNRYKGGIIVNCTPCGMYPDSKSSPVPYYILDNFDAAVDLVYNPQRTVFLDYAKKAGIKSVNGLYMLISQAIEAESIWNDITIDYELIDCIYEIVNKCDKI